VQEITFIKKNAPKHPKNTHFLEYFAESIAVKMNVLSPISETIVEINEPITAPCLLRSSASSSVNLISGIVYSCLLFLEVAKATIRKHEMMRVK